MRYHISDPENGEELPNLSFRDVVREYEAASDKQLYIILSLEVGEVTVPDHGVTVLRTE